MSLVRLSGYYPRMKRISLIAAILAAACCSPAQGQQNLRAQLLWFGNYTTGEVKSYDDPTSPTGKRLLSSGVRGPATNSDRVAIVPGDYGFGFGFRLGGAPNGTRVRTIHIYRFPPPGIRGKDGTLQQSTTVSGEEVVGQTLHIGWRMNGQEPKEYEGVWTLQVWSEHRLLLERSFTLYRP